MAHNQQHSMTREQQTIIIVLVMGVLAIMAFCLYASSENRAAIRTADSSRCWTDACESQVAMDAANRLSRG